MAFAPVLGLESWYVRRVTPRLPEPPGARTGVSGRGRALRLLLVGDSAAAGVGAASQDEALIGRLVDELSAVFRVSWMVVARSGATTGGTSRHLLRRSGEECGVFDVAVVALGGNDVTARRPVAEWIQQIGEVVDVLRVRFAVRHVLLSGLPPMHLFTAFPQPLRWYLGAVSRRFDRALVAWANAWPDCEHVPLELTDAAGLLATDGLHPGPVLYQRWGEELARRIKMRWVVAA